MNESMVSVEVGFAYDNGSWNTDFVTVPIEIFQKEDHNALINYINEAGLVPDGAVGVFLYNWGTGELE